MQNFTLCNRVSAAAAKVVWAFTLLVLLLPGCERNDNGAKTPTTTVPLEAAAQAGTAQPGNTSPDQTPLPEPSKEGVKRLCGDPNPYIRNNAKQALASWDAKDYSGAVIAMQKVISLCKSPSQQADAFSSLAQLKTDIAAAAAKGNRNAKEATAQLEQITR